MWGLDTTQCCAHRSELCGVCVVVPSYLQVPPAAKAGAIALLDSTAESQGECEMLWAKLAGNKVCVCFLKRLWMCGGHRGGDGGTGGDVVAALVPALVLARPCTYVCIRVCHCRLVCHCQLVCHCCLM